MPWLLLLLVAALAGPNGPPARPAYPWSRGESAGSIEERIPTPPGYRRIGAPSGSFAAWLRGLPLKPADTPVRLFHGRLKGNQEVHAAVLDIDVGRRDLQQCADAVMRLRAEYLRASGRDAEICFDFSSGAPARWSSWRDGQRPRVRGNRVSWAASAKADDSTASFRRYLDVVFGYAGSWSLARQLAAVSDRARVEIGDVFIQGGFPGHAVLVVDVAQDAAGNRAFLLAQSYMPAQDIHILRNPLGRDAWYHVAPDRDLITPEWTFRGWPLRRFVDGESCGTRARPSR